MNWYLKCLYSYADFKGRSRRTEYWVFNLANFIIALVLSLIDHAIGYNILANIFSLALLIPSIAVSVRRLHDIGKSGWYLLLSLIPFVGAIILLVFFFMDSKPGSNKWGENPKGL